MTTTTTLSLEPLVEALPSIAANKDAQLGLRLQRLWQERGDFSKISTSKLEEEQEKDNAGKEEQQDDEEVKQEDVVANEGNDQTLTPDQLWELKTTLLQGLGLARNDVTSALDLLQLLLNPLNALNPPVPEEALALPGGSLSSSTLPTPTPAVTEAAHLNNTALTYATKAKAVSKASSLLVDASKRLSSTTEEAQSEWTDLLRLKRAGQWKLEARPLPASIASASTSSVQIDKMARDLCVFCGIEEAKIQWRSAGLARFTDRKGKGKEILHIPERIEGRRRLAFKLQIGEEELSYVPSANEADAEQDVHEKLLQAQKELFEEEIFAELISEARESSYKIQAGRDSLSITAEGFVLTLEMIPLDQLKERQKQHSDLAMLVSAICRMNMTKLYKYRREQLRGSNPYTSPASPPRLLPSLFNTIHYYLHVTSIKQMLDKVHASLESLDVETDLDFTPLLDPLPVLFEAQDIDSKMGGSSMLHIGAKVVDLTFSSPSNISLHLPHKSLNYSRLDASLPALRMNITALLLQYLNVLLSNRLKGWEVEAIPSVISKSTPALAQKKVDKQAVEFIAILPGIQPDWSVELEVCHASRQTGSVSKKVLKDGLAGWLDSVVH